jgi:hypothetical protein
MTNAPTRPSPAIVIAILALVFAVGGTATAGPGGSPSRTKVKKIAKRQADRQITARAPGLSVLSAANSSALEGKPANAFAAATSEPFHEIGAAGEPTYQNGWAHGGLASDSKAGFYKDSLGVVHLKGVLFSAVGSGTAFTLPPGYRPSEGLFMPAATGTLTIEINGNVKPSCPGACTTGIDGLTFRVG